MLRKNLHFNRLILNCFLVILIFGCKEKNPSPNEESELITTIKLNLTDSSGLFISATWRDLTPYDESGRTIDTLFLKDSTLYSGTLDFLDESKNPVLSLTGEILDEAKDHLVVYKTISPLSADNFELVRTDRDENNLEIGLRFSVQTKIAGTGPLRIILRHQPGEKNGTEFPGDTDVDIEIPVKIRQI